jgi:hypothetical protein
MKIKVYFTIACLALFAISCHKNIEQDTKPYYQFTENDKSKLLKLPSLNSTLIYKNQNSEEIKFYVEEVSSGKSVYATGSFWGSYVSVNFYYDKQELTMNYIRTGYIWTDSKIVLEKFPVNSNYNLQNPITGEPTFVGYMSFPLWNGFNNGDTFNQTINLDFSIPVTAMTINGKAYDKVRILRSNNTKPLEPNNVLPVLPRNVNTIYYDQTYGIIGFDDLDEKRWRLQ